MSYNNIYKHFFCFIIHIHIIYHNLLSCVYRTCECGKVCKNKRGLAIHRGSCTATSNSLVSRREMNPTASEESTEM